MEWAGYLPTDQHPQLYNPAKHSIATANHKILPDGYQHQLSYEWALPFRHDRIEEMLSEPKKFSIEDFERMQQDVTSIPARRFQQVLRKWKGPSDAQARKAWQQLLDWDTRLTADSAPGLLYELCLLYTSPSPRDS